LECFRCTPSILSAAKLLIERNGDSRRISKNISSVYSISTPPLSGLLKPIIFSSGKAEAKAIADGCKNLISAGIAAEEIIILLSNRRALYPSLKKAMIEAGVSYESKFEAGPLDSPDGRFVQSVLRIICDPNDRVAHRVLLGTLDGVGQKTACEIAEFCETNRGDFLKLFNDASLDHVSTRAKKALERCRKICNDIKMWKKEETLAERWDSIMSLIFVRSEGAEQTVGIESLLAALPMEISLEEVRNYFWMETPQQRLNLINAVCTRLGIEAPQNTSERGIQVMSMHGAKGLSATVVFIPGLEEAILPGQWRSPYPSLTAEAARMLYVSLTRARIACVVSRAKQRFMNGTNTWPTPSRFCAHLGVTFLQSTVALTREDVALIVKQDLQRRAM
jgi:DNA helicase-2/ATP-dependent DNA helicase PcrA